jgi:hypothetical protein
MDDHNRETGAGIMDRVVPVQDSSEKENKKKYELLAGNAYNINNVSSTINCLGGETRVGISLTSRPCITRKTEFDSVYFRRRL